MKYMVTFKYSSFYEDESENKVAEDTLEYEAKIQMSYGLFQEMKITTMIL